MTLAADVAISTRPYFSRNGLQESRYTLSDPSQFGRPASTPPLRAVARYVDRRRAGRDSRDRATARGEAAVRRRAARGASVPRLAVTITPANAIVPLSGGDRSRATYARRGDACCTTPRRRPPARWRCRLPAGWTVEAGVAAVLRSREPASGRRIRFTVTPGAIDAQAVHDRGGGDGGRQGVSRRLRADRSSRPRGALPLSRRRPPRCAAST